MSISNNVLPWQPACFFLTSFKLGSPLKKKHKLNHHFNAKAVASTSNNFRCNNNKRTSSFNYRSTSGVPLLELPSASFDQYMEDRGRVIRTIFPEKSRSQQLNEEEWMVKMTPIQVLFLNCQPVIHITARCITKTQNFPPEIPGHITKLLHVQITRWELPDLHGDYIPPDFNIKGRGTLYLEKQGMKNLMKNQLDVNLSLAFPPLLSWVPQHILQNIFHSILRNYVEEINHGLSVRLLADYDLFKRNKSKKFV